MREFFLKWLYSLVCLYSGSIYDYEDNCDYEEIDEIDEQEILENFDDNILEVSEELL